MAFREYDIEFTKDQILNAKIEEEPYTHICIDPIFTENVFSQILVHFPPRHMMAKSGDFSEQVDLVEDPVAKDATNGRWNYDKLLLHGYRDFWYDFNKAYLNTITNALRLKFDITEMSYEAVSLCIDNKGAGIGPHVDRFDKLVGAIFYLDDNLKSTGMTLFKFKNNSSGEFDIAKKIPQISNSMYAWFADNYSLYAFDQKEDYPRKTIKYSIQKLVDMNSVR